MKKTIFSVFMLVAIPLMVMGQQSSLSLHIDPTLDIPLASSDLFKIGGSVSFSGEYGFTDQPIFFCAGNLDYSFRPIKAVESLSVVSAGLGLGAYLDFTPRLSIKGIAKGGYYWGILNQGGASQGNLWMSAGLGLYFLMNPTISLGLGAYYKNHLELFDSLSVQLGTSVFLRGKEARAAKFERSLRQLPDLLKTPEPGQGIEIDEVEFVQIFPVFYKYYDDHPIGRAQIRNLEDEQIEDIKISVFINQYMDAPKECTAPAALDAHQETEIELNALFTENVLDITEGTKVAAEITYEFTLQGDRYQSTKVVTLRMYDRNAMTWDDDRKASAFVTAKDPMVLNFSKNVSGLIRGKGSQAINENLRKAIGLHEALSLYGVSYVVDPRTPYVEFSINTNQIDFLQFPRQTLEYKAGDCDDLSILFSAMLESVGIETAFITIPGHIFMAFSVDMKPEIAQSTFLDPNALIMRDEKTWIPVEVTVREGGFFKAWQAGAKEWREYSANDQAGFFTIHEAWKFYEPVGLPGGSSDIGKLPSDQILENYQRELVKFIESEIYPRVAKLELQLQESGGDPKIYNKLGVLYARYGMTEKAENIFKEIVSKSEYVPALINLGNIRFMNEDLSAALQYYDRAYLQTPSNAKVLLALARVHHELENYGMSKISYEKLKQADPQLAKEYAYLELKGEAGARAAEVTGVKGVIEWVEE